MTSASTEYWRAALSITTCIKVRNCSDSNRSYNNQLKLVLDVVPSCHASALLEASHLFSDT